MTRSTEFVCIWSEFALSVHLLVFQAIQGHLLKSEMQGSQLRNWPYIAVLRLNLLTSVLFIVCPNVVSACWHNCNVEARDIIVDGSYVSKVCVKPDCLEISGLGLCIWTREPLLNRKFEDPKAYLTCKFVLWSALTEGTVVLSEGATVVFSLALTPLNTLSKSILFKTECAMW